MTRRRKRRGLTRTDALVTLLLAVFLVAVGAPLASEPRAQAKRVLCKANLGKIGKAMGIYAGDYDDALPRAGGRVSEWGLLGASWTASNRSSAYGLSRSGEGGKASISSCFYLLVKYMDAPPEWFVCPGDRRTSAFKLDDERVPAAGFRLIDAWDFGAQPFDNCSYSYHIPFGMHALTMSRDPNLPVAADRNPWIASPAGPPNDANWATFKPDIQRYGGTADHGRLGNAVQHKWDGQNVLFLDNHVSFERRAYCGLDSDNIYTQSTIFSKGDPLGMMGISESVLHARSERDSLLVHDPPKFLRRRRPRK